MSHNLRKMDTRAFVRLALAGAVAGFVATIPMTLAMKGIHRALPLFHRHSIPPHKITMRTLRKLGVSNPLGRKKRKALTMASHFAYGAGGGLLYSSVALKGSLAPAPKGIIFGLAVWAASYFGWLPAANILPPETEHWKRRAMMALSHVVWGAATGLVFDALNNRTQRINQYEMQRKI